MGHNRKGEKGWKQLWEERQADLLVENEELKVRLGVLEEEASKALQAAQEVIAATPEPLDPECGPELPEALRDARWVYRHEEGWDNTPGRKAYRLMYNKSTDVFLRTKQALEDEHANKSGRGGGPDLGTEKTLEVLGRLKKEWEDDNQRAGEDSQRAGGIEDPQALV